MSENPLASPLVRYGIGLSGATILVATAVLFLDGPLRYVVFGIAVLDAVVTPKILEMAVEQDDEASAGPAD